MTPIRALSLVVRVLAIALVLASPWLKPRKKPSGARSVVYVVDRSASMGGAGLDEANGYLARVWAEPNDGVRLGVVAFDGRAELLAPVGASEAPVVREGKDPSSSDLAAGIRLALATLPSEGHRAMVLLTDARQTRGDASLEVRRAAQMGVRVDAVPIDGVTPDAPVVTAVRPRASHVAERQPVAIDVDVRYEGPFVINWTRDGVPMAPRMEHAPAGEAAHTVELVDPTPPPGVHVYEVRARTLPAWSWHGGGVASEPKGAPAALTAVSVEGKAYAVVFSSAGDIPPVLKTALAESGLEARALPMERAADPVTYAGADLVILADVRVSGAATDDTGLTRAAQTSLVEYVQQGGGLLVTGGVFGLAPEYAGTPLARVIPVEIEDRGHVEDPPVALAIMLDRSGSMAAPVGAHTKIELAIEASLAAAEVLRPTDQVAIASVDTETHWDVSLGPQERLAELRPQVRRVTAGGGGIYVYTAMRDAYAALERVKTPIRHLILFSDTSDSEEQFENCPFAGDCAGRKPAETLAREARAKGITTTVVGIGDEEAQDTPFLRRVAAAAGGRFYLTSEGADLRRIFLSETRVLAQSNLREKKTTVSPAGVHPALEGVDARRLPEVSAYVETGRRVGADTALLLADGARPEGRPMLATWRYGLGKAGAIATDFSEGWGEAWASSAEASKVLRQTVRFLLRQSDARRADATVRMRDRVVEVEIELPPDAPTIAAPSAIDVFSVDAAGASHKIAMTLDARGPGRWVARGRGAGEPIVIVRARDARGALMAEAVGRQDRAPEITGAGADRRLVAELANLADGRVAPSPRDTLLRTRRPAPELAVTWPYALLVAAALVVVDLVLRRFGAPRRARSAPLRLDSPSAARTTVRPAA
ncbi:MAG: VWA domain-containing protein [Labilithrix sp.]|nr:VWA domain-containing protein [Labilithrix sp.]